MSARFTRLKRTRKWTTDGHAGRRRVALWAMEVAVGNLPRRARMTRGGNGERCGSLAGAACIDAASGSRGGTIRMALGGRIGGGGATALRNSITGIGGLFGFGTHAHSAHALGRRRFTVELGFFPCMGPCLHVAAAEGPPGTPRELAPGADARHRCKKRLSAPDQSRQSARYSVAVTPGAVGGDQPPATRQTRRSTRWRQAAGTSARGRAPGAVGWQRHSP